MGCDTPDWAKRELEKSPKKKKKCKCPYCPAHRKVTTPPTSPRDERRGGSYGDFDW